MQEKFNRFEEYLFVEQEGLDAIVSTLGTNIISFATLAGTVTMAAVPALFTGTSVYILTRPAWGEQMARIAGWTTAIGVEAVGMVASHVALKLYRSWRDKQTTGLEFVLAICLMVIYILTVAGIVLFVEGLSGTLQAIGVGSPVLATVLYVARGLYLDVRFREVQSRIRARKQQAEDEAAAKRDAELEAELKRLRAQQSHELKMRELELKYQNGNRNSSGIFPANEVELPTWLPEVPDSLRRFKLLVEEGVIILPPGITGEDLAQHIPSVGTDRTGRNWLRAVGYREMNGTGNGNGAH